MLILHKLILLISFEASEIQNCCILADASPQAISTSRLDLMRSLNLRDRLPIYRCI